MSATAAAATVKSRAPRKTGHFFQSLRARSIVAILQHIPIETVVSLINAVSVPPRKLPPFENKFTFFSFSQVECQTMARVLLFYLNERNKKCIPSAVSSPSFVHLLLYCVS